MLKWVIERAWTRQCAVAGFAVAAAGLLGGADAPTGGDPKVRTFVLSNIYIATPGEGHSCPVVAKGSLDAFYDMLSPEEQAKYKGDSQRRELEELMNQRMGFKRLSAKGRFGTKFPPSIKPGSELTPQQALEVAAYNGWPKGRGRLSFQNQVIAYSACTNPEDFPQLAKGWVTYDGKVAPGMNLDGKATKEDFTGTDGNKGVDNQLFRAVGCAKLFREGGDPAIARKTFISARAPTIIELRGVDDARNDSDVVVNVYAAADPVVRDARGEAFARATFTLDSDPKLRASTRGKIVDGVLMTDPVDLVLNYKEQIVDAPRHFRGARLRVALKPDGTIEGSILGYYTLDSYWHSIEQMTQNGANLTGVSCPGVKQAIDRLADGYRDPKTGRYTAISSAYNFFGVRAFIVEPPLKVAGAGN